MEYLWGFLLFTVLIVVLFLAYRKLRPLFPVKVNCWFCNHDTYVPFGNRNCWDCPHCEQYNGFTVEGDYNKPVPAQYTEDINHPVKCDQSEFLTRGQFLCHTCQRHQLLKIKQLASFEPLNEATYDEEITFYKHHLESVYALCQSCDSVVKRTLEHVNESLTGESDTAEKSTMPAANWTESQASGVVPFTLSVTHLVCPVVTHTTTVCTLLLLSVTACHSTPLSVHLGSLRELAHDIDSIVVCLCGLVLCMLSKLLQGKQRLHIGDTVHIMLWLCVVLVCLLLPHYLVVSFSLTLVLLATELTLTLKHRYLSNVTTPVIRRLSLDGGASGANSDAVSEAVSSVSTSCRQRLFFSPLNTAEGPGMSSAKVCDQLSAASNNKHSAQEPAKKEGDLDNLGKDLGAFLIGPKSNESGYSSGRSSVFSSNAFGPVTEPSLSTGVPFPRPLISPARLSILSFSSSGSVAHRLDNSSQSGLHTLWSEGKRPAETGGGGYANPFLAQHSRPLSMFTTYPAQKPNSGYVSQLYRSQSCTKIPDLFSPQAVLKTPVHSKASSEIASILHGTNTFSQTNTRTSWWRPISPFIVDNKDDKCGSMPTFTNCSLSSVDASPIECDSTTPQLSQLRISSSPKRRKKKTKGLKSQHVEKDIADRFCLSEEEEEEQCQPDVSTISTVFVHPKQDWTWLQRGAVAAVVVSMSTNLFLAWTVWWSSKS